MFLVPRQLHRRRCCRGRRCRRAGRQRHPTVPKTFTATVHNAAAAQQPQRLPTFRRRLTAIDAVPRPPAAALEDVDGVLTKAVAEEAVDERIGTAV